MKRQISMAALLAATALALAACGGSAEPGEDTTTSAPPEAAVFEGRWVADDPEDAFLEFSEVDEGGGTIAGGDGCNGIQGEYFIDDDTARIDRGPGTLKGCPGVDTWLSGVATVVVDGDTMTIQGEDGDELGTLTRSDDDASAPEPAGSPSSQLGGADESEPAADASAESDDS